MTSSVVASLIRGILVPAAVALAFSLGRRHLPTASEPFSDDVDDEMSSKQWLVAPGMVVVGAISGYVCHLLLSWLNHSVVAMRGYAFITLYPEQAIWWILPFFGAIAFSWELTLMLWKMFDRQTAAKYAKWSDQKAGFGATRLLRLMGFWVVLPIAILTVLALPLGTSFNEDGMFIGRYGSLQPRHYKYADVKMITIVRGIRLPNGSFQHDPAIVLDFKDDARWSSADNRGTQPSIDGALLQFLRGKTGLTPQTIDAFPFGR